MIPSAVKVDEGAAAYATRYARIVRMIAVDLHLATAIGLCAVAISGVDLIGWFGAAAAIVLTFARPGLRAYFHVRNRLSRIGSELQVPREDAHELRRRLTAVEDQLQQNGACTCLMLPTRKALPARPSYA